MIKKKWQNLEDSKKITSPPKKADDQFKTAKSFLANRNYVEAEKAFQDFIAKNKNHKNTADAHYWLGRIHYIQKSTQKQQLLLQSSIPFTQTTKDFKRLHY